MPRRARVIKRETAPDPRFGSRVLTRFMNKLMVSGKKSLAERIVLERADRAEKLGQQVPRQDGWYCSLFRAGINSLM